MTLDQFISENKISPSAFAAEIGVAPSTLWRIRRQKVRPSWDTIDAISRVTKGAIKPNDFAFSDPQPEPREAAE